MKVLMLGESPHERGCAYTTLTEMVGELSQAGAETEIMYVGGRTVHGCMDCDVYGKFGECTYSDDKANKAVKKIKQSDGLIVGSPVYYASTSGAVTSFLDRFFYSGSSVAAYRPGAAIASVRRAEIATTLGQLSKYLTITQMPVVSSQYWNMVYGQCPEDVRKGEEGMQIIRVLGRNMAWMLKSIEAGRAVGVTLPETEEKKRTNFIWQESG